MRNLSPDQLLQRLEAIPFWAPLGREALEALISTAQQRHLDPAQLLFAQGENASAIAVVLSGELEISRVDENGHRMRLRALGPGSSVGLSTLAGKPHTANVSARVESDVLMLPVLQLRDVLSQTPDLAARVIAYLGDLVGALTDELQELRFLSLDERLLIILERSSRGLRELQLTHEELAQQVGGTRENISRALKSLERTGAIKCGRGKIEILDLDLARTK